MRRLLSLLSLCLGMLLGCEQALADKRVALVIGNAGYRNVARLSNPAADAAAVTAMFQKADFDVVDSRADLSAAEMRRALREFGAKANDADIAVIYFAGHGIELDGANYLIPVDAQLETDTDVLDETVALDRVLVAVGSAKQLALVILDACRDNPFARTMKRTNGSRDIARGLARIEPAKPNTIIAFAARAGSTASDGNARNSPFTTALTAHLTTPGLDLRKALGFVRDDVLKATNNKQEPFVYGSLGGGDVALVPAPAAAPIVTAAPVSVDASAAIRRDYEFAERVGTIEAWDFFLSTYAEGLHAKLAQAQRNKLAAEQARLAAIEQARLAAEERARLAAEGAKADAAKADELARLATAAQAAEAARIASEQRKAIEDAKVAALTGPAEATAQIALVDPAPPAAGSPPGLPAAMKPAADAPTQQPILAIEIPRLLQTELHRVGCKPGAIEGEWTAGARRALAAFNDHAGTRFDVKLASLDALDAVRARPGRVCPLLCDHGFRVAGEKCVEISCKAGFELGAENTCERVRPTKPPARSRKAARAADPALERPPPPAVQRRPEPPEAGESRLGMAARYAQCKKYIATGGGGLGGPISGQTPRAQNDGGFARLDACARNGGKF